MTNQTSSLTTLIAFLIVSIQFSPINHCLLYHFRPLYPLLLRDHIYPVLQNLHFVKSIQNPLVPHRRAPPACSLPQRIFSTKHWIWGSRAPPYLPPFSRDQQNTSGTALKCPQPKHSRLFQNRTERVWCSHIFFVLVGNLNLKCFHFSQRYIIVKNLQ